MIELKGVSKYYTSNGVTNLGLRNINLKFKRNEIVGIVGDSGSGKSTLLNVICKNDVFDEGEIYYKGNETSYFSVKEMDDFRRNKIGFVFQNYNIIESYTVLENVMVPLLINNKDLNTCKKEAYEILKKVGLTNRINNKGSELSGGEKQRCVIARALASNVEILACDEPTGNLDSKTSKEIIELLYNISKDKLVLIVTHDYEAFKDYLTRKIVVKDGEIIEDSKLKEVETEEENEELELSESNLSRKASLLLAMKNIKSTPKKSIFLFSVFSMIFLILSICMQFIFYYQKYGMEGSTYVNSQKDRIVVYNDFTPLDDYDVIIDRLEKKEIKYYPNAFIVDKGLKVNTATSFTQEFFTPHISKYKLFKGRDLDDKAYECIRVYPYGSHRVDSYKLDENMLVINQIVLKIVGFAYSSLVDHDSFLISSVAYNDLLTKDSNFTCKLDGMYIKDFLTTDKLIKPTFVLPLEYEGKEFNLSLKLNVYNYDNYEVRYEDTLSAYLEFNPNNLDIYELTIFESNLKKASRILDDYSNKFDICYKTSSLSKMEQANNNLRSLLFMGLVIVYVIFMAEISYFIISRIYNSKNTDYQILRTLGVSEKKMSFIVKVEILGIGSFSLLLGLGLSCLIFASSLYLIRFLMFSFGFALCYLLFSYLFLLLVAHKLNKRLFKFSLTKSLKGEDLL